MAGTRDIKRRIKSVKSTQQITKAMKMVSATKLRKAQQAVTDVRPFNGKMEDIIHHISISSGKASHPFLQPRPEIRKVVYLVIGSDRGLCGGFNGTLHRFLTQVLEQEKRPFGLIVLGRRLQEYCSRKQYPTLAGFGHIGDNPSFLQSRALAQHISAAYLEEKFDELQIVYSEFRSALQQTPKVKRLLPVEEIPPPEEPEDSIFHETDYIFEPSAAELLATILPQYVEVGVYCAIQEAKASEHGARMTAMNSATDNAMEMIAKLTLSLNRARQAAITTEISEIVGGADALG